MEHDRRRVQDRGARVVIVTPALADANNGNWQTARRWSRLLRPQHSVRIVPHWPTAGSASSDAPRSPAADPDDADVLIALHALRSADSIDEWHRRRGPAGLVVVLTGTDLYRDLPGPDAAVRRRVLQSLEAASRLVVLQDQAPQALPAHLRGKADVIFQSSSSRAPQPKSPRHLRVVMVGHLRSEKDPLTLMAAARALGPDEGILIDHIGGPLDAELALEARRTQAQLPHYRWLGALPHEATRRRIQRAHLLVHASRLEGGAHVIMEAICSGTPVLASRMAGNVGMLGAGYGGLFEVGDAQGLAQALQTLRRDPARLQALQTQCTKRADLFKPERERAALLDLVARVRPASPERSTPMDPRRR